MISRVVSIVRWRADRLMGICVEVSSRSSERSMWPGLEFGVFGLLPKRRVVDCKLLFCSRLMFLWLAYDVVC